ncbi:MAG: pyridoxamine kinase [Marinifilaceae bacterium]
MTIKKVAVIQDLSGYGRASLTVSIPVLSSMGIQVCPLPTAILSAHSEYPEFYCFDMTNELHNIISHWKFLGLRFDALYSGYMASAEQADIISSFFDDFKTESNFILVDPVLGDNKALYPGMSNEMITCMRKLCSKADIITPNMTEAALLLGKDPSLNITLRDAIDYCKQLSELGPKQVVITSAPSKKEREVVTLAYNREDKRVWSVTCDYVPTSYPGTGDAFAATIVGALLQGDSLPVALDRAVHFINMGIKTTFGSKHDPLDGMEQEKVLNCLNSPLPYFRYELLETEQ